MLDLLRYSPLPASLIHKIALKAQKQSLEKQSAPLQDSAEALGGPSGHAGVEQLMPIHFAEGT